MPAYEYRCRQCDAAFEVRRSISEPATSRVACPRGHEETSRIFSAVAVARGGTAGVAAGPAPSAGGGGCCGGGCCG